MRLFIKVIPVVLFSFAALMASAATETIIFQNGANYNNGHIRSGTPAASQLNGAALYAGVGSAAASGITRALLSFDLSTIPADAVISSVTLTLTQNGVGAGLQEVTVDLMAMDSDFTFSNGTATWNGTQAEFNTTPVSTVEATRGNNLAFTFASTESFVQFVQDSLASGQLNLLIKLPGNIEAVSGDERTLLQFGSKNQGGRAPKLEITYSTQIPEPATVTLAFAAIAAGGVVLIRMRRRSACQAK